MNPFIRFSGAILMLLSLIQAPSLHAQEQLGMRFERFAGLNGATLNPAQSAFMPHPWEVNLVGADVFFENNYCYVTNAGVFRMPTAMAFPTKTTAAHPYPVWQKKTAALHSPFQYPV